MRPRFGPVEGAGVFAASGLGIGATRIPTDDATFRFRCSGVPHDRTDDDDRGAMTVLGLPLSTFLVFVATFVAGSLGAVHYLVVHVLRGESFDRYDAEGT
ncbi:hypothetical protein [Haladaptatus salinisoli]|uniref:hypothetical protein n=1 Tax=Haladaptatus salinisoli TaxID=2884876 RepID=UPI001D0B8E4D|nr:hypothetical protein [Haladaptatus salinisoli]